MKLSLKFREETKHQNPLIRAKIPVSILGLPFLSGIIAGDSSDLSFSLRSNFSTGPSLSLSYHPTLSPQSTIFPPFSVSLKSGIGVFGSPKDSPLVFSASFNPNSIANPSFSLFIKPQFGNFSLFKSVDSAGCGGIRVDGHGLNSGLGNGSVSDFVNGVDLGDGSGKLGNGSVLKGLKMETAKGGILSGIFVAARTSIPVAKRAVVNFRWGVDFPPENVGSKAGFPVLVLNKVSLERVDEGKEEKKRDEEAKAKAGDLEVLKGMCGWMRREVEDLRKENREMRVALEGLRLKPGSLVKTRGEERGKGGKKVVHSPPPSVEGVSEFDRWRSNKSGSGKGGNGIGVGVGVGEECGNGVSELENELQKAIKAAAA
ncbi:uncharacterized protein LOC141631022 [Silene latifolia]|uniref:uncharacterized protein LOC141631022 n=1 Tax=Silene latifolia TaxID=37657 RepID=UPI003D772A03